MVSDLLRGILNKFSYVKYLSDTHDARNTEILMLKSHIDGMNSRMASILGDLQIAGDARIKAEESEREWKFRAETAIEESHRSEVECISNLKKLANYQCVMSGALVVPYPEVYSPMPKDEQPEGDGDMKPQHRSAREKQMAIVSESRRKATEARRKFREKMDLGDVVGAVEDIPQNPSVFNTPLNSINNLNDATLDYNNS